MKPSWILGGATAAFVLYALITSWPEMVRYRRILAR